jgi:NAD(P)-dependent dehydrogenase (short-subunit alcohol dehydrogenase family)
MTLSLKNKHLLITGGSGGIGQIIAVQAKKAGASVTIWDLQQPKQTNQYQAINITDETAVQKGFEEITSFPDTIINCAGIFTRLKPFAALELDEFNELQTNTTGCFLICREALRRYKKHLTIINISSALSQKTIPLATAYSASKAGIDSITRSIAAEYGDKNVLAVSLNPGPVQGEMLNRGIAEIAGLMDAPKEAVEQQIRDVIPSGMVVKPEEIASLALLIAAGQIPSIQGKQIFLDGGFTA